MRSNLVDVEVRLVFSTAKAYLFESVITGEQAWVPKSQCEYESSRSDMGSATMEQSLAEDKRLV